MTWRDYIFLAGLLWLALLTLACLLMRAAAKRDLQLDRAFAAGRRSEREDQERDAALSPFVMRPRPRRVICTWCNTELLRGEEPAAHGFCAECLAHPVRTETEAVR